MVVVVVTTGHGLGEQDVPTPCHRLPSKQFSSARSTQVYPINPSPVIIGIQQAPISDVVVVEVVGHGLGSQEDPSP